MKFFISLILLFTSCGYHWESPLTYERRCSLSILPIETDEEGIFTHELVQGLVASGLFDMNFQEADYRLKVTFSPMAKEVIGFRKDQQKVNGQTRRNMVACEWRKAISAEVTLYKADIDEIVLGPCRVGADVDFDCIDQDSYQDLTFINPQGEAQAVLPFSLGQLEPYEAAGEAALRPLYSRLAQKIIDLISSF